MDEGKTIITERRRQTRNNVYRCLYDSPGSLSKQDIAQMLGLSLPTVHQNLSEMLSAGLILTNGSQPSTGGRPAKGYTVMGAARFAVGIYLTDNRVRIVATDLCLEEIAYKNIALSDWRAEDIGAVVAAELEIFLDTFGLNRSKLLGVGIAMPAVIDPTREEIVHAPTLRENNFRLNELTDKIPYLCHVDNDGSSGGYAEWFLSPEHKSIAYLSLENGVGGAVLLQEERYLGVNNRSGEFGHMCVHPGGLPCKCGKRGCLEAYCSAARISTDLGLAMDEFFEELAQGNKATQGVWNDFLQHLAIGVNNIRAVLDCDVMLGGELSEYMAPYLQDIRQRAAEMNPFSDNGEYIKLSRFPRRAIMLGVALHYVERFIDSI